MWIKSLEKLVLIASITTFTLVGCVDKTPEEAHQEKVNAELSRFSAASGTFRGMAVNQIDGKNLGYIAITLRAYMKSGNSSDGTSSSGTAVLDGIVTLYNSAQSSGVIQASHLDPDSGAFSSSIVVPLRNGGSGSLSINGTIRNGSFTGVISPAGLGPSANFSVVRDAAFPRGGNENWPGGGNGILTYLGSFHDTTCDTPDGRKNNLCPGGAQADMKVRMTVNLNPPMSGETFMNNFSFVKTVGVQIVFDDDHPLPLPAAELNQDAGTLEFNGLVKDAQISLKCDQHRQDPGYHCVLTNSSGLSVAYEYDAALQPARGSR